MLEFLLNKVAALKACNFTKERLQTRCFPVNIVKVFEKHLRTSAYVHFKIQSRIQHSAVKYLKCFFFREAAC